MIPVIEVANQLRKGKYRNVKNVARNSSVSEDLVRNKLDDLVENNYLIKITTNIYVVRSMNEEKQKEALEAINKKRAEIQKNIDKRTKVTVSGELMEDKTFKTEKNPFEIIR